MGRIVVSVKTVASNLNYLTNMRYISGRIVEYDIKAANISVLRDRDIISEADYIMLSSMPKNIREREVGLMELRNPTLYDKIKEGIKDAKESFVSFNRIDDKQILRVANDAVYVNTPNDLKYTKLGKYIEFKPKSTFNSFLNINGTIVLVQFMPDGNIHADVKGIGKNSELHKNFMVYAIVSSIVMLERSSIEDAISYISDLCEKYLRRELSIEYYREFTPESLYRARYTGYNGMQYGMTIAKDQDRDNIDISYNYNILREVWSILLEIYTMRRQ